MLDVGDARNIDVDGDSNINTELPLVRGRRYRVKT